MLAFISSALKNLTRRKPKEEEWSLFSMIDAEIMGDIEMARRRREQNAEKGKICAKCENFIPYKDRNGGTCNLSLKTMIFQAEQGCEWNDAFTPIVTPVEERREKLNRRLTVQVLKHGGKKGYKIFDMRYKVLASPDCAWFELEETGEEIGSEEMKFLEEKSFSQTSCGNPTWGPARDHAQNIGADFILQGGRNTSSDGMLFSKEHTTATFFKKRET